jgi:hypothetical protein
MTLSHTLQRVLACKVAARLVDDPVECRIRMRRWAKRWRLHAPNKEQFELAQMALGNAMGWRDRGAWALEEGAA